MTLRVQSKRVISSLVVVMLLFCASIGSALAACPTSDEISGKYAVCTSGCKTGDLLANANCINGCIGQRMRDDDARYACEKAERDAAALSAQERINQQEAENAKLDAERHARENAASWGAQHRSELVDLGDEATFVNGDVKLMRDGKVVPFTKGTKIGPADVLMTTGIGPVGVGSQVENIRYGRNTVVEYLGMKYDPPMVFAQDGEWDYLSQYGVRQIDEWSWWEQLGLDVGSIYADPMMGMIMGVCAKSLAVAQPEICGGTLLGALVVRGGMYYYSKTHPEAGLQFMLTPLAFILHRNTEFTIFVADDGTTTVTALDGSLVVMDMASRKGINLTANQAITIQKTATGLSTEQLLQRVVTVDPAKVDKFEEQAAPAAVTATGSTTPGAASSGSAGSSGSSGSFLKWLWAIPVLLAGFLLALAAGLVLVVRKLRRAKKK